MDRSTPTWYSVRIDIADGWRPYTAPWTQVYEKPVADIAGEAALSHDLGELSWPWRVRVYEGYNQFEKLLGEMTGGPQAG